MNMTIEFNKLQAYLNKRDTNEFRAYLKELYEKSSDEEKNIIAEFIELNLESSTTRIRNTVQKINKRIGSVAIHT